MDPERFERTLVRAEATVRETIECIDAGAIEIALVIDDQRRLLGTVTDGDVRRALLGGLALDDPVEAIVHRDPVTAAAGTDSATLLRLMSERGVDQVPLLEDKRLVDVAFIRDLVQESEGHSSRDHPVVLMAGGRGTRLSPLTEDLPKPMLPVGDRPLLETLVGQVRGAGFSKILMAVNYRAEAIQDHFGDGSQFGIDITYLREDEPLGSAGALRLAMDQLDRPFVVMNADLLTTVNLSALMSFHQEEGNAVTVAVRQYALELPYGVLELDGTAVVSLSEKPTASFFVNAGIYAMDPSAAALIDRFEERRFDMTDLVQAALDAGLRVGGFPVREYWLDIGHLAAYERAESAHASHFSPRK